MQILRCNVNLMCKTHLDQDVYAQTYSTLISYLKWHLMQTYN